LHRLAVDATLPLATLSAGAQRSNNRVHTRLSSRPEAVVGVVGLLVCDLGAEAGWP
jgi:hypothetical protein